MDGILELVNSDFYQFNSNPIAVRALERNFEIIGEAVKKLQDSDATIEIENAAQIIGLRNLISHAYDSVDNEILWGILINHIPKLKEEIAELKSSRSF